MKKVYTLVSAFLITFGLSAQVSESTEQLQSAPISKTVPTFNTVRAAGSPASTSAVTTIWSDDFSTTTNWTYSGGTDEWDIVTALSSTLTGQGFDAAMNSTSGGNFAFIDSDANPSGNQDSYIEYANSVDCSAHPAVRLQFETYFRQYVETREVLVSNDGGANWDTYTVLTQFGTNTTSPNVHTEIVDITATAGGQANVKIKFHYVGAWDWFWAIDDVAITSAPDHDLELTQSYYNTYADSSYSAYYKMIPMRHANLDTVLFGAAFQNNGTMAQTNAVVGVDVMFNGTSVYSQSSTPINSAVSGKDSVDITTPYFPNSGLGMYNTTFTLSADSADETPSTNVLSDYFEVSANEYRRDNDTVTSGNWFTATGSWEMLSLFKINAADTATAISCNFPILSDGRGVAVGDAISYYIYNDADLSVPVAKNEFHVVTAAEVDGWITLPLPEVTLASGYYYVGFTLYNANSAIGTNSGLNAAIAPLSVLVRTDATDPADLWSYTTGVMPFVRLYTRNPNACAGVTILVNDTVVDNQHLGSINIGVTGGTPGYSYSWSGPNGYTATTQNLSNLLVQGAYEVTITDVFGCSGTNTSTVAGIVTVGELSLENNVSLFPNPNNGEFALELTGIEGVVTISLKNVLGQTISTETVQVNGSLNKTMNNTNLDKGIYFVEVSNGTAKSVIKFVVE